MAATSLRKGIVLPSHTWYARGDDVIILFPIKHWQTILAKRGTSPEEKGYYFCEEDSNSRILSMFYVKESIGSAVHCQSLDSFLDAIKEFTKHQNIHVIHYHTHPINQPSSGDLQSYIAIYEKSKGQLRDFLTIGPRTVELNRVYPADCKPRVCDIAKVDRRGNPTGDLVKLIQLTPEKQAAYLRRGKALGNEFYRILKKFI